MDIRYTEIMEMTDSPHAVNQKIDGGGWDLLSTAIRKRKCGEGASGEDIFTDEIVYVIGHRADAQ